MLVLLNVEPNDQEVSAWCKLHGEEFGGKMIPFGALVYFKLSGSREVEQKHKFDPMGIPGVFAGYEVAPGLHWSRKYRVRALADWSKQNLAYDTSAPIPKLKTPHHTERVELKEPLEFPCKINYEKINATIDGLKEKDGLDGSPDYLPLLPRDDDDDDDDADGDADGDDDDDDDLDGGDGGGPNGNNKIDLAESIRTGIEELEMEGAREVARRADLPPPPGLEQVQSEGAPRVEIPDDTTEHYLEGKAKDGKVYLNDDGEKVMLDSRGRPYRIDDRGFKKFHNSPRPDKYMQREWQRIPHERRKEIIKVQEMEAEAERERRKVERKVKKKKRRRKEEEKKKKRRRKEEEKKKKKSSGSKDKGHDVGVSVDQDYVRRGKVFHYKRPQTFRRR